MKVLSIGQKAAPNKIIGAVLDILIILCLSLAVVIFSFSNFRPATADTETVNISYTPFYNTQYSLSVPTKVTLHSDGSATTLTISVQSWSDFPTNRSLYCDLTSNTLKLSNGSDTVDMVVRNGSAIITPGDRIGLFTPQCISSDKAVDFVVLNIEPDGNQTPLGVYSGNLSFDCGLVE